MNKNLFNIKKGALTTQQIVLLIILIASFVVILYFFISADLGGESEKEVCHNSVVMKSHSALPGDTELNCHRSYICITKDGSCEGMSKPEKKEVENVEEVYQVLADEMAECWWMFGEGKIDYVGKDAFLKKNYCSICSQILFDDSLLEFEKIENGKIDKDNLYEYMSNKTISSGLNQKEKSKTYLEYLLKTNNISRIKQKIVSSGNYTPDKEPSFGEIRVGLPHYVVMGVTSEVAGRAWKIAGAVITAVGGIFIPGP